MSAKKVMIEIANVFTSGDYNAVGNPAGLVMLKTMPSSGDMSAIARKAALPMTAFVVPRPARNGSFEIRYYDRGGRECHICGHGTLGATAHISKKEGQSKDLSFFLNPACFGNKELEITTHWAEDGISIDLVTSDLKFCGNDPKLISQISKALRISPRFIIDIAFSMNIRDYVVHIENTDILQSISPDFSLLKTIAEEGNYRHEGLMVTAWVRDNSSVFDIQTRAFLPVTGVDEDIACGSANCSVIPYWAYKGFKPKHADGAYRVLFPYPPGGAEVCGGVQKIQYNCSKNTITISTEAIIMEPLLFLL